MKKRTKVAFILLLVGVVLAAIFGISTANATVHPNITNHQYCFASATGCIRIQNDGGNGSSVVVGATDINGTAEDITFNPTGGTYLGHPTGRLQFVGHTNEYLVYDVNTGEVHTGQQGLFGDIWAQTIINGGIVYINRVRSQFLNDDPAYLLAEFTTPGRLFVVSIDSDGSGFKRFKNCAGDC